MSAKIKTDRLPEDFILKVCWAGSDHSQYCRYLRAYQGRWICAKGTPAGIKHDQRMQRYLETLDDIPVTLTVPDRSDEAPPDPKDVLFDSGEDRPLTAPPKKPTKFKTVEAKMRVHAGDNCPGRADEFAHLFEDETS